MESFAVSSDLTGAAYDTVSGLWDGLEREFGLRAARAAIHPHVTYCVGRRDDPSELLKKVGQNAEDIAPFPVELQGVGVFRGEAPVVFLRVRKDEVLLRAYRQILAAVLSAGLDPWPHYLPDAWVPHVTLALEDLENRHLPDILRWLGGRRTYLNSPLETLSVVHVVQPEHACLATFPLGGAR
jgi:hypothetical protein